MQDKINNTPPPTGRQPRRTDGSFCAEEAMLGEEVDETPKDYQEVLASENKKEWLEAMKNEVGNLYENQTFDLVEQPNNKPIVSSKWVLKLKRRPDGSVEKFKARLVARGFTQTQGIDFTETFAPTLRMETIRFIINYALISGMEIHQMDVTAAFLNGELEEEIYMKLPEGFAEQHQDPSMFNGRVAKLRRALYGLKQSMRCWNTKLTNYLKERGYVQSQADASLFIKHGRDSEILSIIAAYVDDCIVMAKPSGLVEAKEVLISKFKMTDMGKMKGMLGINFNITRDRITMDQSYYIVKLLEKFGMENSKPLPTPASLPEIEDASEPMEPKQFRQAIGGLLYLAKCTRPDISYAVNQVARKMEKPTANDWKNVKRIFRYLSGTRSHGLEFTKSLNQLLGYSDASYAQSIDRRSTSGYAFIWNGAAITWRSKKQSIIATSSMEAEYIALSSTVKEALWIRKLIKEFNGDQEPVEIKEDNQACIRFAYDSNHSDRTKHIDVRYLFIKERIEKNQVKIGYCPTNDMVADVFTKPLGPILFSRFVELLGVKEITSK
jgi:hypothetical protein